MQEEALQGYRLSPQQRHLWMALRDGRNESYQTKCAVVIKGRLDSRLLKTAVRNVMARHEILRTTFRCLPGMTIPAQVIGESGEISWQENDLSGMDEQAALIEGLFRATSPSFDLEQGPLLYCHLIRRATDDHVMIVRLPAICADSVSLRTLIGELSRAYAAAACGEELGGPVAQYADLAEWQNELMEAEETRSGREYWRGRNLSGPSTRQLSFEKNLAPEAAFEPLVEEQELTSSLSARIESFARSAGTSTERILLACWHILLWRHTGQSEIEVGTLFSGRRLVEIEGALGMFAKYLPVTCRLEDELQFNELIKRIDESFLAVRDRQEYFSWEHLVEPASEAEAPYFPFCFDGEAALALFSAADLTFTIFKQQVCSDRFKIKLSSARMPDGLVVEFHYDSTLFRPADVRRMIGHFQTLLENVIAGPAAKVGMLDLLTDVERRQLIFDCNSTETAWPRDTFVHELFSEQVKRTPESVAVISEEEQVTYRELNERANRLAHYLRDSGVGPEILVGLCLERTPDLFVSLLAVLKVGGAYLPLDPSDPPARLAYMLEDAAITVVLTQNHLRSRLPSVERVQMICLDLQWESISQNSSQDCKTSLLPDNLAYVIYTSGSTGRPKGVMVRHWSLANYTRDICQRLGLSTGEGRDGLQFATVSTITADLGNTCIYPSLVSGGSLHVLSFEVATDSGKFERYLKRHPIDVLKVVPSHLGALLSSQPNGAKMLPRKYLILGGAALSHELIERIRHRSEGCQVINHYGPTETTVGSLTANVWEEDPKWRKGATAPIGRPISNTEVYLLNRELELSPVGIRGELYLGGSGMARGYWRRPELTAERFIPNSFGRKAGARLYRTGDVARYLSDGQVEFLGRADDQVKVRGYRIELGEIEAAMRDMPGVCEAVVAAQESKAGDKSLVAYYSVVKDADIEAGVSGEVLREHLSAVLPDYMIPAAYVVLEAMPLTANGKVDRRALPSPDRRAYTAREYEQPVGEIENALAQIWAELLKVERVGRHDNFFELGGHSLLAVQVLSRLRQALGAEASLAALFAHPVLADFALTVAFASQTKLPPISSVDRNQPLELSFAQQRLWFLAQFEGASEAYHIAGGLRLVGDLDHAALRRALDRIVARHEALRTTFLQVDGRPVQMIGPAEAGFLLAEEDLRYEAEPQAALRRLVAEEARQPFDLEAGPLVRGRLARLADEEHALLATMHHIVSDGWSMGILINELSRLYKSYRCGEEDPLPALPVQYADYAAWQRRWLSGEVLRRQAEYWKSALAGAPALLELPADRPRPAEQHFAGEVMEVELEAGLTRDLKALGRRHGTTMYMTLLAGWAALLARLSGQNEVVIGSPVANRLRSEIEPLIGFFVNTLALRIDTSGSPTVGDLLGRVKARTLEAQEHQDIPFEQVVEIVQPSRTLAHAPVFQTMFGWQNAPIGALDLHGLTLASLAASHVTAKFDLSLSLQEADQRIVGVLEYATALFDRTTALRYFGYWRTLLEAIVANERQAVDRLPLLEERERRQLVEEWNATEAWYPKEKLIHELFEEQVEKSPEAIALVEEEKSLSYRVLNARANQLARRLWELGVRPDSRVAILLERSMDLALAELATLKCGAAYAPIDPTFPDERKVFMVADCAAPVAISTSGALLPEALNAFRVNIDDFEPVTENFDNLNLSSHSEVTAYVMYTSGSTGQPKGVMVTHRAVLRLVLNCGYADFNPSDRVAFAANPAFDATTMEVWAPLLNGGRIVVIDRDVFLEPKMFARLLEVHGVTALFLTTAIFNQYALVIPEALARLRILLCGGERADPSSFIRMLKQSGPQHLIHCYGPTETTTFAVTHKVTELPEDAGIVPLGRPISNTQIYILDANLQPAPIGVTGEIYIGGAGLAQGYFNCPELTVERFLPDPFREPGARIYKTGDLGRWLPDGTVEFLWRNDFQVKIRGFRIELGEIEARLAEHAAIKEAVVLVYEDHPGDKRLVAVVTRQMSGTDIGDENRWDDWEDHQRMELWPSIGEYFVYDDLIYYGLTNDEPRNRVYQAAFKRAVKDKVVVDIGTGRDAILARLCIEAGAKKVYAIEILDSAYQLAEQRIRDLDLQDRIIPIHGDATKVQLPEKVDVCVSEIFEAIGGAEGAAPVINNARRFLKEGGVVIPQLSVTKIAAVTLSDEIAWNPQLSKTSGHYVEKIFEQIGYRFDVRLCIKNFPKANIISSTDTFEYLDFSECFEPEYSREVKLRIKRSARLDGFLVWLNLDLGQGEVIDILEGDYAWFPVFLPVFHPGIEVSEGAVIEAICSGALSENGINPDYTIKGNLKTKDGSAIGFKYESVHHKRKYRAAPFYELLFKEDVAPIKQDNHSESLVKSLRSHLKEYLPEYMMPSAFVVLEKMPLTPSGKIDRRALQGTEWEHPELEQNYLAPRTPVEEVLAGIWAEVLEVEKVGATDNFFELGGHSLLATQVDSRIRSTFRVQIEVKSFFEEPTLEGLARRIERTMRAGEKEAPPPLVRVSREGRLPLSFAQQRLWFINQLEPGNAAYNMPGAVKLEGRLNIEALESVINEIVRRHEALRTRFEVEAGEPLQMIEGWEPRSLEVEDLTGFPQGEREAEARRRQREQAVTGFDLSRGPLLRVKVLKLGEDEHVLLYTMHHIVSDGWSMGVMIREVGTLYRAYSAGEESPLEELPIQYADFAVWQREWLQGEALTEKLEYWRKQLAGLATLELPTDHPRPAARSYRGAKAPFVIERRLAERLRELSRRESVTLFMILLGGFDVLLSRYSGQKEVALGTDIANRNRAEIEGLIGFFVNQLVIRVEVRERESFRELSKRVREVCLGAYAHQDVPFERLVEELQPERDLSRSPLFQTKLILQNAPGEELELEGLKLTSIVSGEGQATKFDLTVAITDEGCDLVGIVEYSRDLFDEGTIERMMGHYANALRGIVERPGAAISELSLLNDREREQIVVGWNRTERPYLQNRCVHELFAEQAERTPERLALIGTEQWVSYGTLNQQTNQLGHYLQRLGVGPEVVVGVCLERSVEMVVAMMGVLKAGGAYLPLDAEYPLERLSYMLEDAGVGVVLTEREFERRLPATWGQTVCLDVEWEKFSGESESEPESGVVAENLAYVIYTSGSTGRPKGVMIAHRGLCNLVEVQKEAFGLGDQSRILQFASLSFDASVWEIFSALVSGGSLHVYPQKNLMPGADLERTLRENQITTVTLPPTILSASSPEELIHLQTVIAAGEACGAEIVQRWAKGKRFFDAYGPTESTVCASMGECKAGSDRNPTIGRPIANTRLYILDSAMKPAPVGVQGELYISGVGVARGYLERPELTSERFVPDMFSNERGERLYRTGDVGRYRSDGSIEFIGRADEQVKIRGYRIEPGEIENVLSEQPGVLQAAVVLREDEPGQKRLVAYVVTNQTTEAKKAAESGTRAEIELGPSVAEDFGREPAVQIEDNQVAKNLSVELRTAIERRLPSYMAPNAIVLVTRLPLTPNGKLDRNALPKPERDAYATRRYEAPVGEIEATLARIWAEALGLERVGRHDDFFDLGGHSLLAVKLISRMRQEGLHADVRALFTTPTLVALAAVVGGESGLVAVPPNRIPPACEDITPEMLPLAQLDAFDIERIVSKVSGGAANVQDIYPLAPLQEGILFHSLMAAEGDPYLGHGIYSFDTRKRLDEFLQALQSVIKRHDILRTAVQWEGLPRPVQVVWRHAPLTVEEVTFEPTAGDIAEQLLARFDPRHFRIDIRQAPLIRIYITHDMVNKRWVMLSIFHHLVDDVTSLSLLVAEIQAHLLGRMKQLPTPLPFRNFVAQSQMGVSREEHEAFFRKMLGDVDEPTLPFGLANVHGSGLNIRGARREVDAPLAKRLRERARAVSVSPASLYHLAWAQVLARVSGRDDVVFGTLLMGRMRGGEDADRVLGLFANTLPVRIRIGDDGVQDSVRQTHNLLAQLLRHEHAPLALAQRCSAVVAPTPLFSGILNFRHTGAADIMVAAIEDADSAWEGIEFLGSEERSNYPFSLNVNDWGEGFTLKMHVQPPIDPDRICAYMHTALEQLAEALEYAPTTPLRDLPVLPASERHQMITEWNATHVEYPRDRCIHELFEEQAARTPDAVAVVHEDCQSTYRELNERANRLAHYLRTVGIRPEARVAIFFDRSLDMIVSVLGVLKAGGSYLPLDPIYPKEHVLHLLEDAQVSVILTQERLVASFPEHSALVVSLDSAWRIIAKEPNVNPINTITPENLAYVIYTSGSTGAARGVMVEHRAVVNLACSLHKKVYLGDRSPLRMSLNAPLVFDSSVKQLVQLLYGHTLCIIPEDVRRDGDAFLSSLRLHEIEAVDCTPSQLRLVLAGGCSKRHERIPALVLIGGEAINEETWNLLADHNQTIFYNVYGPTECTVDSTVRRIDSLSRNPSIGRPIGNVQVYLLDNHHQPVPIGVPGELCIGGAGVARGYLSYSDLTAERFVPDPFGQRAGTRLYTSGDLARYRAGGDLEFIGRLDYQVKIRGHRIEPGEIESRLRRHPAVNEVVILAREDSPGAQRLVAYVVANGESEALGEELKSYLRERLPEHLIPSVFVTIDALPLMPNGKIDRSALPISQLTLTRLDGEYFAPRDALQQQLVEIWEELLKIHPISVTDNFFELGGDSLLMVILMDRIGERLGKYVQMAALFKNPTIEHLSRLIDRVR